MTNTSKRKTAKIVAGTIAGATVGLIGAPLFIPAAFLLGWVIGPDLKDAFNDLDAGTEGFGYDQGQRQCDRRYSNDPLMRNELYFRRQRRRG